ncbi:hypothetical protein [Pseudomonas fluorescens]|uniref:Uncharacterized protein n=1 Tax=Pseudomonas fluorescens TaxID=294 RepID=A0A423LGD6_PSEFL|nr:hypothetical protein [Pseudomonas fluorescens]RON67359.1 hypothetical protein BK671_15445 [Pseudomonas fluorescens]
MPPAIDRLLEITKKNRYPVPPGTFRWRFDSGPAWIEATTAYLERINYPSGRRVWAWDAWHGSHETKDLFLYSFELDYIDEKIIDKTFQLGEQGLRFNHCYLTSEGLFTCRNALSAKVHIKLDPKTGISTGSFEATFNSPLQPPNGAFNLTRNPATD